MSKISPEDHALFVTEAQELLQVIEQDMFTLKDSQEVQTIYNLMRVTHTLKGASASVGLDTIKTISHWLEDVFKALLNPEVVFDDELESLLFQIYEALRVCLTAEITSTHYDESEVLNRTAGVFATLQDKLGDLFGKEAPLPSSEQLGFDITQSIFESGVDQELIQLSLVVSQQDPAEIKQFLNNTCEMFLGLAESLNLPGFLEITQKTMNLLDSYPDQVTEIAALALADFQDAKAAVLSGDRLRGGEPNHLATFSESVPAITVSQDIPSSSLAPIELENSEISLENTFGNLDINLEDNVIEFPATPNFVDEESDSELFAKPEQKSAPSPAEVTDQAKPKSDTKSNNIIPTNANQPIVVRVNLEHLENLNLLVAELLINQNRQVLQDEKLQLNIRKLIDNLANHNKTLNEINEWFDQQMIGEWTPEMGLMKAPNDHVTRFKKVETNGHHRVNLTEDDLSSELELSLEDSLELDQYTDIHFLWNSALEEAINLEALGEEIAVYARDSSQTIEKQQRLLNSLRDDLIEVRMAPIGNVFNRFPKVVQQLQSSKSKKVVLKIEGSEVLIDKAVADKLYDPLLHLIRNAYDHGLESPEERIKIGKEETGQIILKAYQQGNRTIIEVKDDGKGINFEKIRAKAIEQNYMSPQKAQGCSESELLNLLFEQGFSTANQVSDLSGRGVGLDVVSSQLKIFKATVGVTSHLGQGTTFSLQIPLTLMSARLLVTQAGTGFYGFLSNEVQQILIPQDNQIKVLGGQRVLNLDKNIFSYQQSSSLLGGSESMRAIALYSLKGILNNLDELHPTNSSSLLPVLLLRQNEGLIGIEVDQILQEQELVIRPLPDIIAAPEYVYGCSILGDGRITLVLNGTRLIDRSDTSSSSDISWNKEESPSNTLALNSSGSAPMLPQSRPKIMIIEDSITQRNNLSNFLTRSGYQIIPARDGVEALEKLQEDHSLNLILCDIEMPRMNGFEFLTQRRDNPKCQNIPVVMLTSRMGDKYRTIAKGLGANGYSTKPFSETELLSTISELMLK